MRILLPSPPFQFVIRRHYGLLAVRLARLGGDNYNLAGLGVELDAPYLDSRLAGGFGEARYVS
jgi:hypothetical protein